MSTKDAINDDDDSRTTLGDGNGNEVLEVEGDDDDDDVPIQIGYSQTQDNILIKESTYQPPQRGNNISSTQEINYIFSNLNGSNDGDDDDDDDDDDEAPLLMKAQRYPRLKNLVRNNPEAVLTLLKAVDDVGATSEINASDRCAPKANKWSHGLDVCHGGGVVGRGSMAKYGYIPLPKATQFKKKILDIWTYALQNQSLVLPAVYDVCKRQHEEHARAKELEKENSNKAKSLSEKQQQDMIAYQTKMNARPKGAKTSQLPPAARGQVGAGRSQHSTNLRLGNPAPFGVASLQSQQEVSPLTSGDNSTTHSNTGNSANSNKTPPPVVVTATASNGTTPSVATPGRHKPGAHTPERGTLTLHNSAVQSMTDVTNHFLGLERTLGIGNKRSQEGNDIVSKKKAKIERLKEKKLMHKENAEFYKAQGKMDKYEKSMEKFSSVTEELETLYDSSDEE